MVGTFRCIIAYRDSVLNVVYMRFERGLLAVCSRFTRAGVFFLGLIIISAQNLRHVSWMEKFQAKPKRLVSYSVNSTKQ